MSDEKRPTRLLPFRLRRAAHARRADFAHSAPDAPDTLDASDMLDDAAALRDDEELSALLRAWDAPAPSDGARARLLAGFRAGVRPAPLWRRALAAELRVPLPLAACAALALLASLVALAARAQTSATAAATATTATTANEARAASAAPASKVAEVPVERERVVTRVVYVERGAARAGARRPAPAEQPAPARGGFDAAQTATRDAPAQSDANRANAGGVRTASDSGAQSAGEPTSYFTRVDMADFEPADEMKIRIVKRGKTGEK